MNNNTCYFCNEVKPNTDFPLQNKYRFVVTNPICSKCWNSISDKNKQKITNALKNAENDAKQKNAIPDDFFIFNLVRFEGIQ